MKYSLDRFIAAVLTVLLSPLLIGIAIAIYAEDRGPVFFRQDRLGHRGKMFRIWKFRTMYRNADSYIEPDGSVRRNRITRIGKALRWYSLDELPQLFNIIRGEMSFIGPRPVLESHRDRYTDRQMQRLRMRPGITGLAQVNGRNTLKWSERIEYDLYYIDHYSLLLDVKIVFKTIFAVLLRKGVIMDRNPESVDDLAGPRIK